MAEQRGLEPPNAFLRCLISSEVPYQLDYCSVGSDGEIRTHITRILSPLALPVGPRRPIWWDLPESNQGGSGFNRGLCHLS